MSKNEAIEFITKQTGMTPEVCAEIYACGSLFWEMAALDPTAEPDAATEEMLRERATYKVFGRGGTRIIIRPEHLTDYLADKINLPATTAVKAFLADLAYRVKDGQRSIDDYISIRDWFEATLLTINLAELKKNMLGTSVQS